MAGRRPRRAKRTRPPTTAAAPTTPPPTEPTRLLLPDIEEARDRVEVPVDHPLFPRNDGVVRDGDALRTDLRAALRDVAVADPVRLAQLGDAVLGVQRVHLQRRRVDQEARPDELLVLVVVAKHVADVLAQEALDALAELLHALDVFLLHAPGPVGRVRLPRLEGLDLLLHAEVPRHVRHQVADRR